MLPAHFQKLQSNLAFNPSFDEVIRQKHNAVRSALQNIDTSIETKLIGSLQRKTRIQPRVDDVFDIDILVILGRFDRWVPLGQVGTTTQNALDNLGSLVNSSERYGSMNPTLSHPTITFEYRDGVKVELVPAYRDFIGQTPDGQIQTVVGRGYWVPKTYGWELADYDYEAQHVSAHNQNTDGWFVPTIRMLKAARRQHFPEMIPYHLEVIASHVLPPIFQAYQQQNLLQTYPAIITQFFRAAEPYLDYGLQMNGSNTPHVSLDLQHQTTVKNKFNQIKQHCDAIWGLNSQGQQVEAWRALFGDAFPATV